MEPTNILKPKVGLTRNTANNEAIIEITKVKTKIVNCNLKY